MADTNNTERGGEEGGGKRRYYRRRKNSKEGTTSATSSAKASTESRSKRRRKSRPGDAKTDETPASAARGSRSGTRRRTRRTRNNRRNHEGGGHEVQAQGRQPGTGTSETKAEAPKEQRPDRSRRASRAEGGDRQRRSRRRRRSSSSQAPTEAVPVISESIIDAIEHEYERPQSVYVYTHVSRPSQQGMSDFRGEHFPRGGRKLDDFHIDISSLLDKDGGLRLFGALQRDENDEAESARHAEAYADGEWEEEA